MGNHSGTLCANCKLACGTDQCCWADRLEPVPGWEADQTFDQYGEPYSYHVRSCPMFKKGRRYSDKLDDDGCMNLIGTLIRHAENDYVRIKAERVDIEKWIRSRESANLFATLDTGALIRMFRKEAARYEHEKKIIRENLWRIWGQNWDPKNEGTYQAIVIYSDTDGRKHAKLTERAWKRTEYKKPDRQRAYDWRKPEGERIFAWREFSGSPLKVPDLPEGVTMDV